MIDYKLNFKKYKQLIPVIILTGYSILLVLTALKGSIEINSETYEFELNYKHFGALFALLINWISFFRFRQFFKYVLALTLFAGLINIINFTILQNTTFVAFDKHQLGFQPTILWIIIMTYLINFKRINKILFEFFGPSEEQLQRNAQKHEIEKIERFKKDILLIRKNNLKLY